MNYKLITRTRQIKNKENEVEVIDYAIACRKGWWNRWKGAHYYRVLELTSKKENFLYVGTIDLAKQVIKSTLDYRDIKKHYPKYKEEKIELL